MNEILRVKVDGKWYTVEVGDLSARPIRAVVDGHAVEVSVESPKPVEAAQPPPPENPRPVAAQPSVATPPPAPARQAAPPPAPAPEPDASQGTVEPTGNAVKAPMPGTILSVAVQTGDPVRAGDRVCTLEAMKMEQSLRTEWTGVVSAVYVSVGDHVVDGAPLIVIR